MDSKKYGAQTLYGFISKSSGPLELDAILIIAFLTSEQLRALNSKVL